MTGAGDRRLSAQHPTRVTSAKLRFASPQVRYIEAFTNNLDLLIFTNRTLGIPHATLPPGSLGPTSCEATSDSVGGLGRLTLETHQSLDQELEMRKNGGFFVVIIMQPVEDTWRTFCSCITLFRGLLVIHLVIRCPAMCT